MKKLAAILAVTVLALGAGVIYLWQQLDRERSRNADLQTRIEATEARQKAFASRFTTLTRPTTDAGQPAANPAGPAAATPRPPDTQRRTEAAVSRATNFLARPETRQAMRALLPLQFPGLAKELNLSPQELEKFYDLMAKQQGGALDNLAGGGSVQNMVAQAQARRQANDAEVAALLGNKYPQYQQYQQSLPLRQQVTQWQSSLSAGDQLSDAQTKPLIAALSAEQQRITQEAGNQPSPGGTPQERFQQQQQRNVESNRRLVETASTYLSAPQLESYKSMLDEQSKRPAAMLRMLGGQGRAQRPGTAAGN